MRRGSGGSAGVVAGETASVAAKRKNGSTTVKHATAPSSRRAPRRSKATRFSYKSMRKATSRTGKTLAADSKAIVKGINAIIKEIAALLRQFDRKIQKEAQAHFRKSGETPFAISIAPLATSRNSI